MNTAGSIYLHIGKLYRGMIKLNYLPISLSKVKVKIVFVKNMDICRSQTLPRNKSPSNEGFSLRYVSNVVEGIPYLHPAVGSAEEVSLD